MPPELFDRLADAIHENYRHHAKLNHWPLKSEVDKPFAELSEDMQAANRGAAQRISDVLGTIRVRIVPPEEAQIRSLGQAELLDLINQNMKTLATTEHEGWMKERQANGWRHGATRDDAQKLHPCLVPFDQLSSADQEKDRNQVRSYPALIALARLAAVRG